MFATCYFAPRYWAARFWSKVGATVAPSQTQDTLRGMTLSGGVQGRGHPVIGVGDPRGGSFSPGSTRRTI